MHREPLVSVIIPAYNHEGYIERAIRSVLDQTYRNIELVVVDDGSRDGTWDVISRVRAECGGCFQAYTKPNQGVSATLNFGIRKSSGEFVATLASDDRYAPEKIERQVRLFLDSPPEVGLVHASAYNDFGDGQLVSLQGQYTPAVGQCFVDLVSLQVGAVAPTIMFRREAFDRVGGFDEELVAEDVDFYASLAAAGYEFRYDPTPLLFKTAYGKNLGGRPDLCFPSHFRTLAKHADRFSPEEYRRIENIIYLGMGRAAAGAGMLRLAWSAFSSLAVRTRSVGPYWQFFLRGGRHVVLSALPGDLRHHLRKLRSSLESASIAR